MTAGYGAEAGALDAEILSAIAHRSVENFDDLALRIFAHQLRYNRPYAKYCERLGVALQAMPEGWDDIPPVPAAAFKEAALCTFDPAKAFLSFETSGTTRSVRGKHYLEDSHLYDSSLLAGFEDYFLRRAKTFFHFLLLLPEFSFLQPQSSLAYMMSRAAACFGDQRERWYLKDDALLVDRFLSDAGDAAKEAVPVILAGTAFSCLALLDAIHERDIDSLPLPGGSKIMETGGFKGRAREISRNRLYADLSSVFGIPQSSIIAEYGMTELLSQYYDAPFDVALCPSIPQGPSIPQDDKLRVKVGPPWMRSYAVDVDGRKLPDGVVGALVHVDLANRSSCVAVQTEDLGAVVEAGIVLMGREHGAELRGCSLDAESLRVASR